MLATGSGRCPDAATGEGQFSSVSSWSLSSGASNGVAAYAADHRAVFDLLGGHVQLAGRLAGALDGEALAAALLRLVLTLAVLAVLSPALAVPAAGAEGTVQEEREPGAVDRAR